MDHDTVLYGVKCTQKTPYQVVWDALPQMTPIKTTEFWKFIKSCNVTDQKEMFDILDKYLQLDTTPTFTAFEFILMINHLDGKYQRDMWGCYCKSIIPALKWEDIPTIMSNLVVGGWHKPIFLAVYPAMNRSGNPTAETVYQIVTKVYSDFSRDEVTVILADIMQPTSDRDLIKRFHDMYSEMESCVMPEQLKRKLITEVEVKSVAVPTETKKITFRVATIDRSVEKIEVDVSYFRGKSYAMYCLKSAVVIALFVDGHYETKAQWDARSIGFKNPLPFPIPQLG
jgi:hypothetical protein